MTWEEAKYLQHARKNQEFRELVEGGLKFITYGACCVLVTVFLALFLYAHQHGALGAEALRNLEEKESLHALALTAVSLIATAGFLCICVGLWRCLVNTPCYDMAKETMFLCVICFLIGTLFHGISIGVGGMSNFLQLHLNVNDWKYTGKLAPAVILQLLGLGLYILSIFAFNNHLLILQDGLRNTPRRLFFRIFDMYLIFTSLLVGGFVGALLSLQLLKEHPEFIILLGACSLIDFFWFLFRIQVVRGLLVDPSVQTAEETAGNEITVENMPQRLSGMRRILKAMEK